MIEDAAAPAPSAAAAPAPSLAAAPASSAAGRGVKRAPSSEDLRPLAKVPKSPPHAAAAVVEPASPANSNLFLDAWQELEQTMTFENFYSADTDDEDDAKPAEEKDEEEDAKPPAL